MKHDPDHLLAIAVAQHRATKLAMRRLQHKRRLEAKPDNLSKLEPAFLAAVEHDDLTDPVERRSVNFTDLEQVPA